VETQRKLIGGTGGCIMIIQIRGTSGSGKTWAMRRVMEKLGTWTPYYEDNLSSRRRRPLGYILDGAQVCIAVLGGYEAACGGCDTIGSAPKVYQRIIDTRADVILCEGLLLSEDVKWTSQLPDVYLYFLGTPLEKCLERIEERRREAGNTDPLDPFYTTKRVRTIERARIRLVNSGVYCRRCSGPQAVRLILRRIRNEL